LRERERETGCLPGASRSVQPSQSPLVSYILTDSEKKTQRKLFKQGTKLCCFTL